MALKKRSEAESSTSTGEWGKADGELLHLLVHPLVVVQDVDRRVLH